MCGVCYFSFVVNLSLAVKCEAVCLYSSETCPLRKENGLALQRAEMRMIGWACGVIVIDKFMCNELRERLGIDDIITVVP